MCKTEQPTALLSRYPDRILSERPPIALGRALKAPHEGTVSRPSPLTLRPLDDHLHALQVELDVQTKRIAQMQAELDVLPIARKRRDSLRELLTQVAAPNGNGHRHD